MTLIDLIEEESVKLGYRKEAMRRNYSYSDVWSPLSSVQIVPFAAFTQTPPSYRSAAFAVIDAPQGSAADFVENHRSLGAPAFIALEPGMISVWQVFASKRPLLIKRFAPDALREFFAERKDSWAPDAIHRAKSIGRVDQNYQLDFVDIGLIQAIEGEIHGKLDRLIREAISDAQLVKTAPSIRIFFRGVFRLLAAKILMDRKHSYANEWDVDDVRSVLKTMDDFYNLGNTSQAWPKAVVGVLALVWQTFKSGFNVANISSDDLAYVYETTLVTDAARAQFGTHSTPRHMADYIVGHLRLWEFAENLPRVYEPFAGAGIFLCAALRYLRDNLPSDWSDKQRHDLLVQQIGGAEIDPFAAEVAKLSLILADYPNTNGWLIEETDLFKKNALSRRLQGADVILCNPPFEAFKGEELTIYSDAAQVDHSKAVFALESALRAKPKMLGFVVPNTLLVDRRYSNQRTRIEEMYDDIEIVALPDGVFNVSQANTALLIARKLLKNNGRQSLKSSVVFDKDKKRFSSAGEPSVARELSRDKPTVLTGKIWVSHSEELWRSLADLPRLGSILKGSWGIRWKSGQVGKTSSAFSPGRVRGYQNTSSLHQFVLSRPLWMDVEPSTILAGAGLAWDKPKILCNATRLSRGYWRLAAAVDRAGRRATQQFIGFWPRTDIDVDLDALVAIINSPVLNAFLTEHSFDKRFRILVFEDAPLPHSIPAELGELSRSFVAEATSSGGSDKNLLERIDDLVFDAYSLSGAQRDRLRAVFENSERPLLGSQSRRRLVIKSPQSLLGQEGGLFGSARVELEIINLVRDWAGGNEQAQTWYRSQPIPALGGQTPEELVKAGRANAVREYIEHLALGGFA